MSRLATLENRRNLLSIRDPQAGESALFQPLCLNWPGPIATRMEKGLPLLAKLYCVRITLGTE